MARPFLPLQVGSVVSPLPFFQITSPSNYRQESSSDLEDWELHGSTEVVQDSLAITGSLTLVTWSHTM